MAKAHARRDELCGVMWGNLGGRGGGLGGSGGGRGGGLKRSYNISG